MSLLVHLQESREDEVVLQCDVLFQVKEELSQIGVHQPERHAAVSRCGEVVGQLSDVLPSVAGVVVLQHQLFDGGVETITLGDLASLLVGTVQLIEAWEDFLLLLGEMFVEVKERLLHRLGHLVQLGMMGSVDAFHLLHQPQQVFVIEVEVAVMLLQHVVEQQIQRPGSKVWG